MTAFPQTHWSLVLRAGEGGDALGDLLRQYQGPMKAFLRARFQLSVHEIDDALQEFIVKQVLAKDLLGRADSERGRFRDLLRVSLSRFVQGLRRAERAVKRDQRRNVSLTPGVQESGALAATEEVDPFDYEWACEVIRRATEHFEGGCREDQQSDLLELFRARVVLPAFEGQPPEPYDQLITRLGLRDPATAQNRLITAKRRFATALTQVVAEYACPSESLDHEIGELKQILSSPRRIDASPANRQIEAGVETSLEGSRVRELYFAEDELAQRFDSLLAVQVGPSASPSPWAGLICLGDALDHPRPEVQWLESAKDFAKREMQDASSPWPRETLHVVYYAAICAARIRRRERISAVSDEVLAGLLPNLAGRLWVHERIRGLFATMAAELARCEAQ